MLSTDSEVRSTHWLAATCEGTTEEVWYDWSVYRISSTDSIRTTCEISKNYMWKCRESRTLFHVGEEEYLTSDFKWWWGAGGGGGGGVGGGRRLVGFIFLQKVGGVVAPKFTAAVPSLLTGNCEWIVVFNISYFGSKKTNRSVYRE